jgi:excisionase family DNA binding protein
MGVYLTTIQVARLLKLSDTRVQQLTNSGKLKVAARAGWMRLFDLADVQAFIEEHRR